MELRRAEACLEPGGGLELASPAPTEPLFSLFGEVLGALTSGDEEVQLGEITLRRGGFCPQPSTTVDFDHHPVQLILDLDGETHCTLEGRTVPQPPGALRFREMKESLFPEPANENTLNLLIPFQAFTTLGDGLHGVVLPWDHPLTPLIGLQMAAAWARRDLLSHDGASAVGSAILTLVNSAIAGRPGMPGKKSIRSGALLRSALAHIDKSFGDAGLSADTIATALGVSRRTIYRAFDSLGGVSAYVREQRLERAYRAISHPTANAVSLSAVALSHGFLSDSHFSRAFVARFGLRPGALAKAASREQG